MIKSLEGKKKRITSPKQNETVSSDLKAELKSLISESVESAVSGLWQKIEKKLNAYENRFDRLENQIFDRDQVINELQEREEAGRRQIQELEERVDELERHSRASNLIFRSERFGKRKEGEDIAAITIAVINESFPDRKVGKADFSNIHRLQNENTVICVFNNKMLRNAIYEDRIKLSQSSATRSHRLYVNESLTAQKREIFGKLLELKKRSNVWTVFTRDGIPCFKHSKESPPTRVYSMQQLTDIMEKFHLAPPSGSHRAGGGGAQPTGGRSGRAGPSRSQPPPVLGAAAPGVPAADRSRPGAPPGGVTRAEYQPAVTRPHVW